MGVFSKYFRYREAGEDPNVNNVERFGRPFRSLFTSTKVFTLHHRIVIVDETERVAYRAETKAISLHDKTDLFDAYDNPVAHIERKVFTIHERHLVTMADGTYFELSNELFHIFKDITNIEGLGWQLRGNVVGLNFELYDETGGIVAVISQKAISMHDRYCVDVYRPDAEPIVVAILITLQHMMRDRAARASAYSQNNN